MTSLMRSMSVRSSWKVCMTPMRLCAGALNCEMSDCMDSSAPEVNSPAMMSHTPRPSTAALQADETKLGTMLSRRVSRSILVLWLLTLAWKPDQRRKNPGSTPWALSVSIIEMPAMVALERFALSLMATRVALTRLDDRQRAQTSWTRTLAMPTEARSGE